MATSLPAGHQPLQRPPAHRAAVTLVELLVVMAVLAALAALLLPAIHQARHAARRTNCRNNLRQIGLALNSYHALHRAFPPGGVEWRPQGNRTKRQLAWSAFLLPQIEEQALFARLDFKQAFDSPENAAAAAVVVPVYLCPDARRLSPLVSGRGACDFGGIFGERISGPNNPPRGVMLYDVAIALRQIRDGASKTLIVGEDSRFADGQWINGRNIFDQAFAINAAPDWENDLRSDHPGGAHAATADGAVHFLSESLDLRVLAALCTRAGGEPWSQF